VLIKYSALRVGTKAFNPTLTQDKPSSRCWSVQRAWLALIWLEPIMTIRRASLRTLNSTLASPPRLHQKRPWGPCAWSSALPSISVVATLGAVYARTHFWIITLLTIFAALAPVQPSIQVIVGVALAAGMLGIVLVLVSLNLGLQISSANQNWR
jgi:hypothetical protein